MSTVGGDTSRLGGLPGRTDRSVAAVERAADRLVDALHRVVTTTDAAFRPGVVGDDEDVRRWTRGARSLDQWVAHAGRVLAAADAPELLGGGWVTELGLTPEIGDPSLPPFDSDPDGGDGRDGGPLHPDVATFDELAPQLGDQPVLLSAWWDSLSSSQRDRIARARWPALLAMDGLSATDREGIAAAARADLPERIDGEQFGYEIGWGVFSWGTTYEVTRVVQHDGDVLATIAVSDSLAAKLPERFTRELVEVSAGLEGGHELTLAFATEDAAVAALEELSVAFLPGPPNPGFWEQLGAAWSGAYERPETALEIEYQLADLLEGYEDHVVASERSIAVTGQLAALEGVLAGDGALRWTRDAVSGNTSATRQLGGSIAPSLPIDVTLPQAGGVTGELAIAGSETTTLDPDGGLVSTTRVTTATAAAGLVEVDLEVVKVEAGTELGTSVTHTVTDFPDGSSLETLVVADTESSGGTGELDLSQLDPRLPSIELTGTSSTAETTAVWVRDEDGTWVEITAP